MTIFNTTITESTPEAFRTIGEPSPLSNLNVDLAADIKEQYPDAVSFIEGRSTKDANVCKISPMTADNFVYDPITLYGAVSAFDTTITEETPEAFRVISVGNPLEQLNVDLVDYIKELHPDAVSFSEARSTKDANKCLIAPITSDNIQQDPIMLYSAT